MRLSELAVALSWLSPRLYELTSLREPMNLGMAISVAHVDLSVASNRYAGRPVESADGNPSVAALNARLIETTSGYHTMVGDYEDCLSVVGELNYTIVIAADTVDEALAV